MDLARINAEGEQLGDAHEQVLTYTARMVRLSERSAELLPRWLSAVTATSLVPTVDNTKELWDCARALCDLIIENGEAALDFSRANKDLYQHYQNILALVSEIYGAKSQPHDPQIPTPD